LTLSYTEDAIRGRIVEWINEFIREENLPFDRADAQIQILGNRYPDIIIWETRLVRPALLIELKRPSFDPWMVGEEALGKAWKSNTRFFATWNINQFHWWDRNREGDLFDQLCDSVKVVEIKRLEEVDRVERSIRKFLRDFLKDFSEVYFGRKPVPLLPLDERFIARLRSFVDALYIPVFYNMKKEFRKDRDFRKKLIKWFVDQGYIFTSSDDDLERVARQYVYLIIDKIMFYNTMMIMHDLPSISIRSGLNKDRFSRSLQKFFDLAMVIDYETIFAANFLDTIPPPDEVIPELNRFIDGMGRYDLSKIGYEVIGRVFERLIPEEVRHKLGQYFTRSDIVDLILGFCVKTEEDTILDPACGAGTFLIRSYERKNYFNNLRSHTDLLEELYGIDIAKFPAHLSTINLAIKNLEVEENYPFIFNKDFFDINPGEKASLLVHKVKGLDKKRLEIEIPLLDAVVMNPPYTRHEEMEDLVFTKDYKEKLQKLAKSEIGFTVGKRSSIYSYFFFHGGRFLKEGGMLGLITSNSWLDVGYGKYIQRFLLEQFKIKAIIESKVERWFEDADINTCITILEKCRDNDKRDGNFVKFVYLKKPLDVFIPPAEKGKNDKEKNRLEHDRWSNVNKLVKLIESTNEYYVDEKIKIFPKNQKDLYEEGYYEG